MNVDDKALVMAFLAVPRLKLSPAQLRAIERVIDTPAAAGVGERVCVPYAEAMAALGFRTVAGVRKLAKEGHLELYRLPGRSQAIGVRRDSLDNLLKKRAYPGREDSKRTTARRRSA
ncbi:MAG: hypothetical protein J6V72_12795 [Kiritimatiellae bacterium]|nr:hypothetical protein [Kiritimatiellia bacterium]